MGKANRIAVFADLHFTVESGRLKGDVLRWVELPADVPEETSSLCIGVAPRGAKLTLWIRNVELLRFGVGDH